MANRKEKGVRFHVARESETRPALIVSDPQLARVRSADRVFVPVVTLDITDRRDLRELFAAYTPDRIGDIALQWGLRSAASSGTVTLFVRFSAPVRVLLVLDFEIIRHAILVDRILRTGELYIEGVTPTNAATVESRRPTIRVVVPDTKFAVIWDQLLSKKLTEQAKTLGATARDAELLAKETIRRWRLGPQ